MELSDVARRVFPSLPFLGPNYTKLGQQKGTFCDATQRGDDQYEILLAALHIGGKLSGSFVSVKGLIVL